MFETRTWFAAAVTSTSGLDPVSTLAVSDEDRSLHRSHVNFAVLAVVDIDLGEGGVQLRGGRRGGRCSR